MSKSKITLEFFLPTTSFSRLQDALASVVSAVESHKGTTPFVTISGPHVGDELQKVENGKQEAGSIVGRAAVGRDSAGSPAGEPGGEPAPVGAGAGDGDDNAAVGPAGDDERGPVKRGRGRPPGSAGKARSGAAKREREDDGGAAAGEVASGSKPVGTRQGSGEGSGEGEGRSGSPVGSGDDQRGSAQAPRLTDDEVSAGGWEDDDEDWGEEVLQEENAEFHAKTPGDDWPDHLTPDTIDAAAMPAILAAHYKATGGKDRGLTFDVMNRVSGVRSLNQVPADMLRDVAKALIKDTARYTYGVKKAK